MVLCLLQAQSLLGNGTVRGPVGVMVPGHHKTIAQDLLNGCLAGMTEVEPHGDTGLFWLTLGRMPRWHL